MIASLPMYPFTPSQVDALWQALKATLPGPLPVSLSWPDALLPHWRRSDLLLSQTCGYPLMTALPTVQVVGAFHYAAPGCAGPNYRSWIVVRSHETGDALADFRGRRLAYNSKDSQSGFHALKKLTAEADFFSARLVSGGHRASLALLRDRRADIAAVDCVSWALLARDFPRETHGLKIIGRTASVPGLPLITAAATPAAMLAALRDGLARLVSDPRHKALLNALLIDGFSVLPRSAWHVVLT